MAVVIKHALVSITPDDPAYEIKPSDWNHEHTITGLATVASTGAYSDLTGKPTLGTLAGLNSVDLTANVTGILPVPNGGLGAASYTANEILFGAGTSPIAHSANLTFNSTTGTLLAGTGLINVNTASGIRTGLFVDSDSTFNVFVGGAGNATLSGTLNAGLGGQAAQRLTTGNNNLCVGTLAGQWITSGNNNLCVGVAAMQGGSPGISGAGNVALGTGALGQNLSGSNNVGLGTSSCNSVSSSGDNVGIGAATLVNAIGNANIAIGSQAGTTITTGDFSTIIGKDANVTAGAARNRIVLGWSTSGDANNQAFLGNTDVTAWVPGTTAQVDLGRSDRTFKQLWLDYTNSATVGAVTINKISGTCNMAALAGTLTVTNSLVTANSRIMATLASDPGVALSVWCVGAAGSFTVNTRPAVVNQTAIDFLILP